MANIKIDSLKLKAKNGDTYELSVGSVDTSTLASKDEVAQNTQDINAMLELIETKAEKTELDALKEQVENGGSVDTSIFATKDEIPDASKFIVRDDLDVFSSKQYEDEVKAEIKAEVLAEYVPLKDLTEVQIDKLDEIILSGAVSLNDLVEVPIEQIDTLADIVSTGAMSINEFEVVDLDAILNRIGALEQEIQTLKENNANL